MNQSPDFVERIRERYPQGLTGIFAVGGTRMTYILTHGNEFKDPGQISEFDGYADYAFNILRDVIGNFFELGGQNAIVPVLSYQLFNNERGPEYAELTAKNCYNLMEDKWVDFYREMEVDPYFTGIDTLLHFPETEFTYELGVKCTEFNENWSYQEGRRKLIWEIAPIPLFSFWRAHQVMGETAQAELDREISGAADLQALHDSLYRYYARAVYGTDVPMPNFYVGTNRNGDLKLRALLPIALLCGGSFRMFFTPYPSLFMTRETLQGMLEDLAFGKPLRSTKTDYSGQVTSELIEMEYQRVLELSADPGTTLGLVRKPLADKQS
jgi:hypothetical protein